MEFHQRLKELRQKTRLTQGELARIIDLKPTAISNYESNRNEPSFAKLIALSKYFDVSCDYLLGVTDTFLPIGGEILDRNIVEFFGVYQQLDDYNATQLRDYAEYLLQKQESLNREHFKGSEERRAFKR